MEERKKARRDTHEMASFPNTGSEFLLIFSLVCSPREALSVIHQRSTWLNVESVGDPPSPKNPIVVTMVWWVAWVAKSSSKLKRCHEDYFKGGDFSKYPCINEDGNCQINYELPSIKCKYCRFLKCSLLGMNPTRILGEEARKKFCSKKHRVAQGQLKNL